MNTSQENQQRIVYLHQLIQAKTKALKSAPEGNLKAYAYRKGFQYAYRKADRPEYIYIRKSQIALAQKLAQKKYDQRVLDLAKTELSCREKLLRIQQQGGPDEEYQKLPEACQVLVTPIEEPFDLFSEKWQEQEYEKMGFQADSGEFYSSRGERVRSKTEVLIADLLARKNIPHLYEKPLVLKYPRPVVVHPDFTLLRQSDRKEVYLEHMGMMSDSEYSEKAMRKILTYEKNGFYAGDRLLITYESAAIPVDMKLVEAQIDQILKRAA